MAWEFLEITVGEEESGAGVSAWPAERPEDYSDNSGNIWGYNPDTEEYEWRDYEAGEVDINALGGGRYNQSFIAITSKGEIFYS